MVINKLRKVKYRGGGAAIKVALDLYYLKEITSSKNHFVLYLVSDSMSLKSSFPEIFLPDI